MVNTTTRLSDDALAFLSERHLAMLTTLRADNSPHVVAVGFTFDPKTHIARVIHHRRLPKGRQCRPQWACRAQPGRRRALALTGG